MNSVGMVRLNVAATLTVLEGRVNTDHLTTAKLHPHSVQPGVKVKSRLLQPRFSNIWRELSDD